MKIFSKRYHPPGTSPGTLKTTEPIAEDAFRIHLIEYNEQSFKETEDATPEQCQASLSDPLRTWVHMQGPVREETLSRLGELFGLHDLALEDVVNVGQRPKAEVHDDHLFSILSLPFGTDEEIQIAQVSLFLGRNFLVSFCSGTFDPFEPVRRRLRGKIGRIRAEEVDYLMYAVLDVVIDQCFPILESIGEEIEYLEEEVLERPERTTLTRIHMTKRDLLLLRRMLWPHRDVVNTLLRDEGDWFQERTKTYLRDCYDHAVQITDLIDTSREMTAGLLDIYLSNISNRMNDIMRVLTVIATVFIPLTFLVGVYGMNFVENNQSPWAMPELRWYYGYPLLWGVMIAIVVIMVIMFKRKRWF